MNVARILADKGRDVLTTQPHRTVKEVAAQLASRGVGAVVVSDAAHAVLGIVSERDIVRAIGAGASSVLEEPVSRYMTAKVTTVDESASIDRVMELMTEGRFRHLPVVENGRLVGIVSIGDVVKRHVNAIDSERRALRDYIATA
ncbi:MAG: CBS domain-containing protein [Roseiarcus sp.]|jgi:CBS domain-containing protein